MLLNMPIYFLHVEFTVLDFLNGCSNGELEQEPVGAGIQWLQIISPVPWTT